MSTLLLYALIFSAACWVTSMLGILYQERSSKTKSLRD